MLHDWFPNSDLCLQNGLHLEEKNWMQSLARDNGEKPLVLCTDGVQPLDLICEGQTVKDPHAWFDWKQSGSVSTL